MYISNSQTIKLSNKLFILTYNAKDFTCLNILLRTKNVKIFKIIFEVKYLIKLI